MTGSAKVLKFLAIALMGLVGTLGGLFIIGEAFSDPGGWRAVAMTAAWVLPLIALSLLALRSTAQAAPVFVGVTALVVLFTLADSAFGIIPGMTGGRSEQSWCSPSAWRWPSSDCARHAWPDCS